MIFVLVEDLTKETELVVDMYVKRFFYRDLAYVIGRAG